MTPETESLFILCSKCFTDFGLQIDAEKIGVENNSECSNCKSKCGRKLNNELLHELIYEYFVLGSISKHKYGSSPRLQYNEHHYNDNSFSIGYSIDKDIRLLESTLKIGIFHYGPRLWMLGEIEPLKKLQNKRTRTEVIQKIIETYPVYISSYEDQLFRLRKNPQKPSNMMEYDSPPADKTSRSRLGTAENPIMYTSPDIECCIHECRVTLEDELYIARLSPSANLKLLNLSFIPKEDCTEFDSLDITIQMLFVAGKHAYRITNDIANAAKHFGYDGIIYPSYFNQIRTGIYPFQTIYGISTRRIDHCREAIMRNTLQNVCIFGRPIHENKVTVHSINRLVLRTATYNYHFGPVVS